MKKLMFSLGIIIIFAFYVLFSSQNSTTYTPPPQNISSNIGGSGNKTSTTSSSTNSASSSISSGAANPPPIVTQTPPATVASAYKDGTYDGSVDSAFYGNVQVAAVIQGGKITDVQFLQYPSDNEHSHEVSNFALPTLKQEVIQSQSANVDAVSGATATSQAFQQSLASALAQAKN